MEAFKDRTDFRSRMRRVLNLVEQFPGRTSAELARANDRFCSTAYLLEVRRGLADAKRKGLVEWGPARECRIAGTKAITWRAASR